MPRTNPLCCRISRLAVVALLFVVLTALRAVAAAKTEVVRFASLLDGKPDVYGIARPTRLRKGRPSTLLVYLHGMGSNYQEPLLFPNGASVVEAVTRKYPEFIFVSLSYGREASWGVDRALDEITENIHEVSKQYDVARIILIGSSMGGCTVLNYAAKAPQDIKEKLLGIVSVESSGDLQELYRVTGYAEVQPSMEKAFGGTPEEKPALYRHTSFLRNIPYLDPRLSIFLVSAHQDTTVPPRFQHELYDALRCRDFRVKLKEIDGAHGVPPAENYTEGLAFVLGESDSGAKR